jgi:hypothetical protein
LQNLGEFFRGAFILWLGVALFVGLMLFLALAINNWRKGGERWVSIATVFGTLLGLLFTATAVTSLKEMPNIGVSGIETLTPPGGSNYIYVSVTNNGDAIAKACTGEIEWTDVKTGESFGPQLVVWGGGKESADILPYGGSIKLYLLVTNTGEPVVVIPDYMGAYLPPRPDNPQRIYIGDYLLTLTVRSENARPSSAQFNLSVGNTWDELKCIAR